jgi:NitT/TauT family transport system permease protein
MRWAAAAAPVGLFLALLAAWETATRLLRLPAFVLPSPLDVVQAAWSNRRALGSASMLTAAGAACGFLCSCGVGCLVAFVFSQSALIRRSCYPYAIFLQTVPIVAIAPLIIIWFGTGLQSVILVSTIVSLFPIIANATIGLTTLDRDLLDLFALYDASRWDVLWKLRLPAAVPYLIAGAKTSSGLSVIGAIVGEFFAGYGAEKYGLGYLVILTSGQLKTAFLFAAIVASTSLGLLIFGLVGIAGDLVLRRWYRAQTHG